MPENEALTQERQQAAAKQTRAGAGLVCKQCGASLEADAQFCPECGGKVGGEERTCQFCQTLSASEFCPHCGRRVIPLPCPHCGAECLFDACENCGAIVNPALEAMLAR